MRRTFFITTAIDYTNGAPHIGHAYEKVLADVIARYHRLKGDDVFFLTGVDQHGQKVQQSAEKQGVAPQEFVDGITAEFLALWKRLGIQYDGWAATTDERHKRCVRGILQRLKDEGQLYRDSRAGYYSVRQEQFLTDKERGMNGEFGPEWGEVVLLEEENYFFRLAEHKGWLLKLIDQRDDFITPAFRRNELRNAVEKLAGDLCVSRPKARLSWGIEFPFDPEFVTYVWFDALVNYISFAGYDPATRTQPAEFTARWPALHVIGKDILIPAHGIYWPIMLHTLGFADEEIPPLLVHGWWNIAGTKMSKSTGNSIDPHVLADNYGEDALRYYLVSDIATGKDADFSEERLVQRYNSDLANGLGNLLNRTLTMGWKYREGRLAGNLAVGSREDRFAPPARAEAIQACQEAYSAAAVHTALEHALSIGIKCNQYIDSVKPWVLARNPELAEELDAVLSYLAGCLRTIAILISPVMPIAAHGILDQLNWRAGGYDGALRFVVTQDELEGGFADGHQLGKPSPLFPKIDVDLVAAPGVL